jgi:hypothetical protein
MALPNLNKEHQLHNLLSNLSSRMMQEILRVLHEFHQDRYWLYNMPSSKLILVIQFQRGKLWTNHELSMHYMEIILAPNVKPNTADS